MINFFYIFLKELITALGVINILIALPALLFIDFTKSFIGDKGLVSLFFIIIISIVYGIIKSIPFNKIYIKIKDKLDVNIKYGDIFNEEGIIIIPVNEYFDTIVDNEIISRNTVHGQFIEKYFLGEIDELNRKIDSELIDIVSIGENTARKKGNKKIYNLGTSIKIRLSNKQTAILIVLTRFDSDNIAYIDRGGEHNSNTEFQNFFISLFTAIHKFSQGKPINITLIGSGISGLPSSKQKNLEYILFLIYLYSSIFEDRTETINIILNKVNKKDIYLNNLNTF